jgi:glucose-6-phosphate dehydrogenase assembly protein OpcA
MSEPRQSTLIAEPRFTDVSSIESELIDLWKEAERSEDGGESGTVIRACSANLIIVTHGNADGNGTDQLLDSIAAVHPSRTFLVLLDQGFSSREIETYVSARCSIPLPGEKQVCCEQINLRASILSSDKIASVITSLLVPDIPVILFWIDRLAEAEDLPGRLVSGADHAAFDPPDDPRNPFVSLRSFINLHRAHSSTTIGHLAWDRIQPWRIMVAGHFDDIRMRKELASLCEVSIVYSAGTGSPLTSSLFLLGWLAHSLEWKREHALRLITPGTLEGVARMGDREIALSVRSARSGENRESGIHSLVFRNDAGALLTLKKVGTQECVCSEHRAEERQAEILAVRLEKDQDIFLRQMNMADEGERCMASLAALMDLVHDER